MKNRVFSVTLTIALALALTLSTALTSFGAVLSEYDKVYQWNKHKQERVASAKMPAHGKHHIVCKHQHRDHEMNTKTHK